MVKLLMCLNGHVKSVQMRNNNPVLQEDNKIKLGAGSLQTIDTSFSSESPLVARGKPLHLVLCYYSHAFAKQSVTGLSAVSSIVDCNIRYSSPTRPLHH